MRDVRGLVAAGRCGGASVRKIEPNHFLTVCCCLVLVPFGSSEALVLGLTAAAGAAEEVGALEVEPLAVALGVAACFGSCSLHF